MSDHPSAHATRGVTRRPHNAGVATTLMLLLGAGMLFVAKASAADTTGVKPTSRSEAIAPIAEARRIVTPEGIERLERVRIGGIEQWISIRGNDRRNPVLLLIHGGPGYVSMPLSWWNARGWEEYFTVVHWDQRAAGKTHLLTDPDTIAPTLTLDRMYGDAEDVVAWLRSELDRDKIFVVGHSWGTYLGLRVALERPEWLHAYVGVAQVVDMRANERANWKIILDKARAAGHAQAIAELEALAPYAAAGKPVPMQHVYTQRRWGEKFGGTLAYRDSNRAESALVRLSPEYSDDEIGHVWDGNDFAAPHLFGGILDVDFSSQRRFETPIFMFLGRHDTIVYPPMVSAWLDTVEAPAKQVVWFEHSAHSPMSEEPGRFLLQLVQQLRPIAEQTGDVPPAQ